MSDMQTAGKPAVEELSFREATTELEGIVRALEGNQLELEASLACYERGVALLRSLQSRLSEARQRVDVLLGELEVTTDEETDTQLS